MYNFSFFAYTRYRPDTHRYEVVQKERPVRSKISPLLLLENKNTVRNGEKGVAPVVSGRRLLNNEDVGAPKDFSFYAFADPREGLARVNVHDMDDVIWAITTRADAARDTIIINNTPTDTLDPASPLVNLGSKMGIDATQKTKEEGYMREIKQQVKVDEKTKNLVDSKWSEYGL